MIDSVRNLPGGLSYWQTITKKLVNPPLVEDASVLSYSYLVIGAGLTGIATALHLGSAGHNVLVVEAGPRTAWRASGRNGGHVWPSSHAHASEGGHDKLRFEMQGAEMISDVCTRKIRGSCELACSYEESVEQLQLASVPKLDGVQILTGDAGWHLANLKANQDGYGGILQPNTATVNPVELANILCSRALDTNKVHFMFNSVVKSISKDSPTIVLEDGRQLTAKNSVIVCTNAFTGLLLPELAGNFIPKLSQIVAVPCEDEDPRLLECTLAAANDTLYISRPVPQRILIGGEDIANLDNYLREHTIGDMPNDLGEEWYEYLCITPDGRPLVGPVPGRRDVLICAGYNGNGLPLFYECARAVALYASGRSDEVAVWIRDYASPDRIF
ncbi:glycine oxidase, putative [Perkinsus marinus ATCC 50983]|uniref:Glycine oxidase, putative n=1 Tax=Perkinsus marinus (strain ATCC 50983 / TXsc) TaxID=423536 RepID=C5KUK4_PERM5|nr:glycine oxidase, putative [Perkinsus marinus ATCC 50983]EER11891.1 glycine oxidase, putative [Perkinsus marinus ATCC 50983]|eukprot:XP_002780096.1 glycine oxidase, putative [Perkinsus marinus ATCC 50983]